MTNYFIVDVEVANGLTPAKGTLTEFAAIEMSSGKTFHGRLWETVPDDDNPAIPVIVNNAPYDHFRVLSDFVEWIHGFGEGRAVMISDNPAFDFMWISYAFEKEGLESPFGFSARRIGDFYAGLNGNFKNANSWKKLRRTKHTHNPVDDVKGNWEALNAMMLKFNIQSPWG